MLNREVIFGAGKMITPDLAAEIAQCASKCDAVVYVRYKETDLCVDSLIGILSMNIHAGSKLTVKAEGNEAEKAVDDVCAILRGTV